MHTIKQEFSLSKYKRWNKGRLTQTYIRVKDPSVLYFKVKKKVGNEVHLITDHIFMN
jgi:hypothetical protein